LAESYRGLTVRIGADTTKLSRALRSATQAAAATEGQLRRLRNALRLDGTNVGAAATQLKLIRNNATEAATKLHGLRAASAEVGDEMTTFRDATVRVADLADGLADVNATAAGTKAQFAAVTAELAEIYTYVTKIARDDLGLEGVKFDADNSDIGEIEAVLRLAEESGVELNGTIGQIVGSIESLKGVSRGLNDDLGAAKAAAGFQDLGVEISASESKLRSLSERMVDLGGEGALSSKVGEGLSRELGQVTAALDKAKARFRELDSAARIDPGNVEVASERSKALAEATMLAERRVRLLGESMDAIGGEGLREVADASGSAALDLERTRDAAIDAAEGMKELEGRVEATRQRIAELTSGQANNYLKTDAAESEVRELTAALEGYESELAQARQRADETFAEFTTAKAQDELARLRADMASTATGVGGMATRSDGGMRALAGVVVDVGQYAREAASYVTESADEVDSAYRDMRKTVNGTEEDFERLRDAAMDYSQTHFTSADTILEMEAMGGQLGIATKDLEDFARVASNLDIATDIDADEVAKQLGQLSNILGWGEGDMERYGDALVRLGNNMPALESDITNIATRVSSQGKVVGMSTDQVLAWSTALASTGQKSEAAGTALARTMSQIEAAVGGADTSVVDFADACGMSIQEFISAAQGGDDAVAALAEQAGVSFDEVKEAMSGGNDKLERFAAVAGMSAEEFQRSWGEDASGTLEAFVKGLKGIDDAGGSMDATLADLGITAVRQKQGLVGLTQTTETLDDALEMSADAWNGASDQWGAAGDAAREADRKTEGFSGSLAKLRNSAQVAGARLGDSLVPLLDVAAAGVQAFSDAMGALPEPVQTSVGALGALAAAAATVVPIASVVRTSWKNMFPDMATKLEPAKTALSGLVSSVGALAVAHPVATGVLALGTAVGVAAVASYEADRPMRDFRDAVADMADESDRAGWSAGTLKDGLSDVSEDSHDAALSVDDLTQRVKDHNATMDSIRETYQANAAELANAASVVERYEGRLDLTTKEHGELAHALEVLNGQLGTSITQEDVARGKYVDQDGAVQDLTESLDKLVAARQNEARQAALQESLTEAYREQYEAEKNLANAKAEYKREYDAAYEASLKTIQANKDGTVTAEEQATATALAKSQMTALMSTQGEATKKLEAAQSEADKAADEVGYLTGQLGSLAEASSSADGSMAQFVQGTAQLTANLSQDQIGGFASQLETLGVSVSDLASKTPEELRTLAESWDGNLASMTTALDAIGISTNGVTDTILGYWQRMDEGTSAAFADAGNDVAAFAAALDGAGISSEQLAGVGIDNFARMAAESNGSIDSLIAKIREYVGTDAPPKEVKATAEGKGEVDELNDSVDEAVAQPDTVTKTVEARATGADEVEVANKSFADAIGLSNVTKTVTLKANGTEAVDKATNSAQNFMHNVRDTTKTMNLSSRGEDGGWALARALDNFASKSDYTSKTIELITRNTTVNTVKNNAAGGIRANAAGGFTAPPAIAPRYHAHGAIATSAVPLDIVGEAGAEAIVPLTNRAYAMPFVRMIADELGATAGGITANFYVYDARDPEAFARQSMRSLERLARGRG
jgi:TP901 family phage tail tape measure protein